MSKIKIIYFNIRGRAELSRLIAAAGGLEFEDVRVEGADWPKLKESELPSNDAFCGREALNI